MDALETHDSRAAGDILSGQGPYEKRAPERLITSTSSSDVRLDVRMSSDTKRRLSQAAELSGATVFEFVRAAADARARAVLEDATRISLEVCAFERFVAACDRTTGPNEALRRSAERARGYRIE